MSSLVCFHTFIITVITFNFHMTSLKRIRKEFEDKDEIDSPYRFPNGCYAEPQFKFGEGLRKWKGLIIGPKGTCYEGGYFHLDITFPSDYPFKPMKILFETKIYHPQVHSGGGGQICLAKGYFKDGWTPALTLSFIFFELQEMLKNPDKDYPWDPQKSYLLEHDPKLYDKTAREWVLQHAPPPKQPMIENVKYEYSISEQHVLCTFNASFAHCEVQKSKEFRLIIHGEDESTEHSITREQMEYSIILPETLDYGTSKCIELMLLMDDTESQCTDVLPYTSQWQYLYLDALTDQEYVLLITGFWRECCPEMDINTDLVGICHRFYDHPFDITMRWKITRDSGEGDTVPEERTIRLTDAKEINCKNWTPSKTMKWIRKTFLNAFGMKQAMDDFTFWEWSSNIGCNLTSGPFKAASYPKTIDIFMDFERIKCFDAEYEGQIQRISFLMRNEYMPFVKDRVKTSLGIDEDVHVDRIKLCVDERIIETEDELEQHLLPHQCIVLCHVSIDPVISSLSE